MFIERHDFIENAFERRFQAVLQHARRHRTWHLVAAVPGSGKSSGIADLVMGCGRRKAADGTTRLPILAVCAPKNTANESALGAALTASFGVIPPLPWSRRRTWLVHMLAQTAVELLLIDDAHDLSLAHLAYLKELTDNLAAAPYLHRVGLCLVGASEQGVVPLRETLEHREGLLWRQFRRRLDAERPYCLVRGHTEDEVREVLAGYEDLYREQFAELALCRWAGSIYQWLTHPALDLEGSRRVTMDHLARLVTVTLRRAHAQGATNVDGGLLRATADLMTLRRDAITAVDGEWLDACQARVAAG
jgi:type II secretory pathway predicted ATPase ExeA